LALVFQPTTSPTTATILVIHIITIRIGITGITTTVTTIIGVVSSTVELTKLRGTPEEATSREFFSVAIQLRHLFLEPPWFELRMSSAKTAVGLALFVFWCCAALGDILLEGAIYCDSAAALSEMVSLARAGDNQGLAKLIAAGHVEPKALQDIPVKVLARGEEPDSPLEFAFPGSPATFWTLSRWVTPEPKEAPASPSPSPSSTPVPASPKTATKASKREATPPFDDQGGEIIWHQVDGKWKWRPRDPAHFKGVAP